MSNAFACSCGSGNPHVTMERRTYDGYMARYFSDGRLVVGNTTYAKGLAQPAALLVFGDIELYNRREVVGLVSAARAAMGVQQGESSRERMREMANPTAPYLRLGGVVPVLIFPPRTARE